jgi:NADH-quinone oxidoreductase subunit F
VALSGSELEIELDILIPAIGQSPDVDALSGQVDVKTDSTFEVTGALATSRPGVFAAGDAVLGPASIVEAVGQGNAVARAVDHYLRTGKAETVIALPAYEVVGQAFNLDDYAEAHRPEAPYLAMEARQGTFREVELGMDEDTVREECKRCLRCDLEWLEEQGLAMEPVPVREVEKETVLR